MNDLKPSECTVCLPWGFSETSDNARKKHCTVCAGTGKVYAIHDTHRVVSVELLRKIEKFADEAQSHYSGMNDEVCQSYSEQWQQALIIMGLVGAIIDNKGEI